jgi:hypothetical protein
MTERAVLSFRVPDDLRERLLQRAADDSTTVTKVMLSALQNALDGTSSEPDGELSAEQRKAAREAFAAGKGCVHCSGLHLRACPRVKSIRFRAPGEPAAVRYWKEGQFTWPDEIIWPEEVQET